MIIMLFYHKIEKENIVLDEEIKENKSEIYGRGINLKKFIRERQKEEK